MSIKTEIEWFEPSKKYPKKESRIIYITYSGYFVIGIIKQNEIGHCEFIIETADAYGLNSFSLNDVKYWAYLPKLPEFE